MSISLNEKKIFQKEKYHSSVFQKAFQISRKKFHVIYTFEGFFTVQLLELGHLEESKPIYNYYQLLDALDTLLEIQSLTVNYHNYKSSLKNLA